MYTPQPVYQQSAVAAYFRASSSAGTLPPMSLFAANNRAYPDVSLQANAITAVINGQVLPGAGTSAGCPLFAAMLALIVDRKIEVFTH